MTSEVPEPEDLEPEEHEEEEIDIPPRKKKRDSQDEGDHVPEDDDMGGILHQWIVIERRIYPEAERSDERDIVNVRISETTNLIDGFGMLKFAEITLPDMMNDDLESGDDPV